MSQTSVGALKICAKTCGLSVEDYQARVAAGNKWCIDCRDWHPVAQFGIDKSRFDGLASHCLAARRVVVRKSHKGRVSTFKGHTHTLEARQRMSAERKGRPSEKRGIPRTPEVRLKISRSGRLVALRGLACPAYKDGRTAERRGIRFSAEYKRWRFDVFARDGFACQHCGDDRGGNLHAHHIKPFATHPELRLVVSNGITLCEACHKIVHETGIPGFN